MAKVMLALDPGGTTGWVRWEEGKGYAVGHMGPQDHHLELHDWLGYCQTDDYTIICESFEFRQRARSGLELVSKEYIGVVKLFQQERMSILPNQKVAFQTAAQGKGFITDDKIKRLDLWTPGMKHAMDAMRHMLYYQVNKAGMKELMNAWK